MRLDPNADPLKKSDNRMLGVGLAAAAGILMLVAAFSRSWVARPLPDIGFGPMGCYGCAFDSGGGKMSNGEFIDMSRKMLEGMSDISDIDKQAPAIFPILGWITFVLCIIGGLALLATAFLGFRKIRKDLPISPPTIALLSSMAGLIVGCVFVVKKPLGVGGVGVSMGFWMFAAAVVAGIIGAQMLAKLIRPVDPDLLDGAINPDQY